MAVAINFSDHVFSDENTFQSYFEKACIALSDHSVDTVNPETIKLLLLHYFMDISNISIETLIGLRGKIRVHEEYVEMLFKEWKSIVEGGNRDITLEEDKTAKHFLQNRWFAIKELYRFVKLITKKLKLGKSGIERILVADGFEGTDLKAYLKNMAFAITGDMREESRLEELHLRGVRKLYGTYTNLRMDELKKVLTDLFQQTGTDKEWNDVLKFPNKEKMDLYRSVVDREEDFKEIAEMKMSLDQKLKSKMVPAAKKPKLEKVSKQKRKRDTDPVEEDAVTDEDKK